MLGVNVKDFTGGFKCFRSTVLGVLDLDAVRAQGYSFQIELTYRAFQQGFTISEIPIMFGPRAGGRSKMSTKIALEAFWTVIALRRSTSRAAAQEIKAIRSSPRREPMNSNGRFSAAPHDLT